MAFVTEDNKQITEIAPLPFAKGGPDFNTVLGASIRQDTILGNFFSKNTGLGAGERDEGYNAFKEMTKAEAENNSFRLRAIDTNNVTELNLLRENFAMEQRDREILSASPGYAFTATLISQTLLEPINLVPILGASKVLRSANIGKSYLKGAGVVAGLEAGVIGAQESVLLNQQITRTGQEAAMNVAAGALLGGVLGIPFAKAHVKQVEKFEKELKDVMDFHKKGELGILSKEQIQEAKDAGAAETRIVTDPVQTFASGGEVTGKVVKWLLSKMPFDPYSRTAVSESKAVRKLQQELVDSILEVDGGSVISVENKIQGWNTTFFNAAKAHNDIYTQYLEREGKGLTDRILGEREFDELVGRAVSQGSDDDLIEKAASAWREQFYEPLKKAGIKAELLDEDVITETSKYYRNRVYNVEAIMGQTNANGETFTDVVAKWLQSENDKKLAYQGELNQLVDNFEGTAKNLASNQKSLETKTAQLDKAKDDLDKLRKGNEAEYKRAIDLRKQREGEVPKLEAEKVKIQGQIDTLRAEQQKTRKRGGIKPLQDKLKQINQDIKKEKAKLRGTEKGKKGQQREAGVFNTATRNKLTAADKKVSGLEADIERLKADIQTRTDKELEFNQRVEDIISALPSKIGNEVRSKLKADGKVTPKERKKAIKAILDAKYGDFDELDFQARAEEIKNRIISSPDATLEYSDKSRLSDGFDPKPENRGKSAPFRARTFTIPDELIQDFLENDINLLAQRHLMNMAPDIEIKNQFGALDMADQFQKINDDYAVLISKAPNNKARAKLEKAKARDLRDLKVMIDRMRNVHGNFDPNNMWHRVGKASRDLNYMRLMGGVVASSIPDLARIVMSNGLGKAFGNVDKFAYAMEKNKPLLEEIQSYGIAIDSLINGRGSLIADIQDVTKGGTKLERALSTGAKKFSNINLMNQWTTSVKFVQAISMQSRLADDLVAGRIPKELKRLGINDSQAERIGSLIKEHGTKSEGNWLANRHLWDDPELEQLWAGALRQETNRVIVTPGQEKPIVMSTQMGQTLFQFKSFIMSAQNRVMLAGLQKQDEYLYQGLVTMVGLGMMTYIFKQWNAGREVNYDIENLIIEGIDRSGALGVLWEINNMIEKLSGNNFGVRSLANITTTSSRQAGRSIIESAMGPTFGTAGNLAKILSGLTGEGEMTESDKKAFTRLMVGQNLFYIRRGNDKLVKQIIGED
jgi:hypothetical protein